MGTSSTAPTCVNGTGLALIALVLPLALSGCGGGGSGTRGELLGASGDELLEGLAGHLGDEEVKAGLVDGDATGLDTLATTAATMVAIMLGILAGAAVGTWLTAVLDNGNTRHLTSQHVGYVGAGAVDQLV